MCDLVWSDPDDRYDILQKKTHGADSDKNSHGLFVFIPRTGVDGEFRHGVLVTRLDKT